MRTPRLSSLFEDEGRADRTVKIGEKQLSLPEMERGLETHPLVAEAALLVLPRGGEPRVHAVIVPTPEGHETLRAEGRRAFRAQLAEHLAASWDPMFLPRAWRSVDELPRDRAGKLALDGLQALFHADARDPIVESEQRSEDRLERRLRVPEDLAFLEGHFEGFPVVPGAVQVGWAIGAAGELLGHPASVRSVEALKFPSLLRPGDLATLTLEVSGDGQLVRFVLRAPDDGARVFASGRCVLGDAHPRERTLHSRGRDVKPCLLIPIYDHGREIPAVLEALAVHALPCLVIDDGSAAPTHEVLDALAAKHAWVEVHRREKNGGRGAALKAGYRLAHRRGFTHAIQLDADGQHDPADVPRFLEAAGKAPDALVLGAPVFDESVPKGRLYGRQLSRGMVWGLTGSFRVKDPLCGFRGIPLQATVELLDATRTGDHMEFDPELVIALVWSGAAVCNVPTRVVYGPSGVSHFDMVRDNARIAWVYTRAVFALPRRFARCLRRRHEAVAS